MEGRQKDIKHATDGILQMYHPLFSRMHACMYADTKTWTALVSSLGWSLIANYNTRKKFSRLGPVRRRALAGAIRSRILALPSRPYLDLRQSHCGCASTVDRSAAQQGQEIWIRMSIMENGRVLQGKAKSALNCGNTGRRRLRKIWFLIRK